MASTAAAHAASAARAKVPLSDMVIAEACGMIASADSEVPSLGLRPTTALIRCGVMSSTASQWLARGREMVAEDLEAKSPLEALCLELVQRVHQAEGDCETDWVERMNAAITLNHRAWAGWMTRLERRFPESYRRPSVATGPKQALSMEEELARLKK